MRIYMVAFSEKGRALAEKIQNISLSVDYGNVPCEGKKVQEKTIAVSYTHLTLPTNSLV